jgi:hypothetical protein
VNTFRVINSLTLSVSNRGHAHSGSGLARTIAVDEFEPMGKSFVTISLRVLTWCCVIILAVLSLLPARMMVRTGFPGVNT